MKNKNQKSSRNHSPAQKKTVKQASCSPVADRITANRFIVLLKNNSFCLLSAALTLLVLLLALSLSKVNFGFGGEESFLYSDMFAELVPMLTELRERLLSGDFSLWSWSSGMGGNYLGTAFYYLMSPANALVLLTDNIESAVIAIVLIKVSLSAFTAAYFFKKSFSDKSAVQIIFGCSYALCGWFSAYYFLMMWLDALYILPFLLLGCRKIIDKRKPALLFFSAAYILIVNFYMAYMLFVFTALYWFAYYFSTCGAKEKLDAEKPSGLKNSLFFRSFTVTLGVGIAAVLTSAAVIIPEIILITRSGAGNVEALTVNPSFYSRVTETLSALIPQSDRIRLLSSTEYPNIYSGVLALSFAPLYFLNKSINRRKKLIFGGLFTFVVFSLFSGKLAYMWHGFAEVNDFPYRFSFVFSFLLICFACVSIVNRDGLTAPRVLISAGIAVCVIVSVLLLNKTNADSAANIPGIILALSLTVVYSALVCSLTSPKADFRAVIAVMLVLSLVDACADFTSSIATAVADSAVREEKKNVQQLIENTETDNCFFRSELSLPVTYNQGAWYGFNGISISSSLINEKTIKYLAKLGLHTNGRDGMSFFTCDPVTASMLSLKYIYDDAEDQYAFNDTRLFTPVSTNGKYTLLVNKYTLPMIYAVNGNIMEWGNNLSSDNIYGNLNAFAKAAAGIDGVLTPTVLTPVSKMPNLKLTANADGSYSFDNYSLSTGTLDMSFTAPESSSYYYYINMSFDDGHSGASVNSGTFPEQAKQKYDLPFSVYVGYYKAGETVPVSINVQSLCKGSFIAAAAGVDYGKLDDYCKNITSNGEFIPTVLESGIIEGEITLVEDKFIMTSVPYDTGWQVYIDGNRLSGDDIFAVSDAMLGFSLTKGTHTVRLAYSYTPFTIGICVSSISAAALIAYAVMQPKKRKTLLTEAQ